MAEERGRLRKVGALWKAKEGSTKSKGSGSVTIGSLKQKFVVLLNEKKKPGSREPDYLLLSSDEPEVDEYARPKSERSEEPAEQGTPF